MASNSAFDKAYCARVKKVRERRDYTQQSMADSLDISLSAYQKYEQRTPLPPRLIERFCLATLTDMCWLVTGQKHHDVAARKGWRVIGA